MQLPEVVQETLLSLDGSLKRMYIKALIQKGWTLKSVGKVLGISRQRVSQIEKATTYWLAAESFPLPNPPIKQIKDTVKQPKPQIGPEALKKLLRLYSIVQHSKVSNKKERWEFANFVDELQQEGVSFNTIGKHLNLTGTALQHRLIRYGLRKTTGNAPCLQTLKGVNNE